MRPGQTSANCGMERRHVDLTRWALGQSERPMVGSTNECRVEFAACRSCRILAEALAVSERTLMEKEHSYKTKNILVKENMKKPRTNTQKEGLRL